MHQEFFSGTSQTETPIESQNNVTSTDKTLTKNVSEREIVMEHNYAEYPSSSKDDLIEETNTQNESSFDEQVQDNLENAGIRVKLKYINDDLKLVDGKLDEMLGDFKK